MAQTNINIRMDASLKRDSEAVCGELRLTMTAAFTVFAKAVSKRREIPFRVSARPAVTNVTLASEKSLAREWLREEEASAWDNLKRSPHERKL